MNLSNFRSSFFQYVRSPARTCRQIYTSAILLPERLLWKMQLDPSGSITLSDKLPSRTAAYAITPVSLSLRHIIVPMPHL
jgi:hypothetical protein